MTTATFHDTTWRTTFRAHLAAGDSSTCSRLVAVYDYDHLRATLATLSAMVAAEFLPNGPQPCPCGRGHNSTIVPDLRPGDPMPVRVTKQLVALAANEDREALADLIEVQILVTRDLPVRESRPYLDALLVSLTAALVAEMRR